MFTHVTVELPRVIEAAGLPLVRDIIYERSIYFFTLTKKKKQKKHLGLVQAIHLWTQHGWSWRTDNLSGIQDEAI